MNAAYRQISSMFKRRKYTNLLFSKYQPKLSTTLYLRFQVLFFDFNCSALDLCDEPVTIEVLNSRKIRSDSLIGAFKFDLGLVYESTGFTIVLLVLKSSLF